jgi:uncharacterized protein
LGILLFQNGYPYDTWQTNGNPYDTCKTKVRILSIDGGGIRGLIPALILGEIERLTEKPVSSLFDLIAGTSTGGILALALCVPNRNGEGPAHSASDVAQFYIDDGPLIFSRSLKYKLASVNGLLRSHYPSKPIEQVLEKFYGGSRLKDSLTSLLIPSYELRQRTPFFFRSSMAKVRADYDYPMHIVARSTSAAPTYFSPTEIANTSSASSYLLVDGGVFANNPAACALVEAKVQFPHASEITLVSLGTGTRAGGSTPNGSSTWGVAQWARPILNTVLDGVSSTVHYQLSQLLPPHQDGTARYYRFQPMLAGHCVDLDDTSPAHMTQLKQTATNTIEQNHRQLETLCRELTS